MVVFHHTDRAIGRKGVQEASASRINPRMARAMLPSVMSSVSSLLLELGALRVLGSAWVLVGGPGGVDGPEERGFAEDPSREYSGGVVFVGSRLSIWRKWSG
jgi:hypothetical protein